MPTSTPTPLPAPAEIRERRFTWSHSRKRLYDDCPRAYYYRYYGSRDGWLPEAPPLARALYVLKGLKGRPLWAGNVVHEAVEELLRETREGKIRHDDPDYVVESVLARRMRPQWKASREGRYMENPREHAGLLEHHYDHKVSRAEWALLAEDVKTAIRTFLDSKYWALAERLPEKDWLLLEDLESFELDGVPVWVRCDFAYRDADGTVVIVDWKTGRRVPTRRTFQLGIYGLYAAQRWDLDAAAIRVVELNLTRSRSAESRVEKKDLDETRRQIETSIRHLKSLLADVENDEARSEDFPPKPDWRGCSQCPYLEACREGQTIYPLNGPGKLGALV